MQLSDLLFKAGGLYDPEWRKEAYLERADLIRINPDSITRTVEPFNLCRILAGDPSEDRLLRADDRVQIYSGVSRTCRRSAEPSSLEGVLTAMKITSDSVARSILFLDM